MENKPSMFISTLKHGVLLGIALIVYALILYLFDATYAKVLPNLSFLIIAIGLFLAAKAYRDKALDGSMSYGKALGYSFVVLIFASLLNAIYSYIFNKFIDPEMMAKGLEMVREELYSQGLPEEQLDMTMSWQEKIFQPGIGAIMGFFGMLIFGFIISLITSIFVKKQGDPYQEAMQDIDE